MESQSAVSLPQHLDKQGLILQLKNLVATERKITAQILTFIAEIDRRKLYFEYHFTSLFDFLTQEIGYSKASAQRRIDSARLLNDLPEIKCDLESGALNLSQVSLVAQGLRQERKDNPGCATKTKFEKYEILSFIKNKDFAHSQQIVSQALNLEVKAFEKRKFQKDESLRIEMTLSKEQTETITRAKELISHISPNPTMAELLTFLAKDYIRRKDPRLKTPRIAKVSSESELTKKGRKPIQTGVKRFIFQRDRVCQWKNLRTRQICGSKFQLEIDHKISVSKGGANEPENLQLLCRVHNVLKYEQELPENLLNPV